MAADNVQNASEYLAKFVQEHGIAAEIIHLEVDTLTVAAAAEALDVAAEQIIKTILFMADGEPVLVIACGQGRVDRKLLAAYLGVSPKHLKIASAPQVLQFTGYSAGGVPPFGHKETIWTVVEAAVYSQFTVYGGGGESRSLMKLTTAELRRIVGDESTVLIT